MTTLIANLQQFTDHGYIVKSLVPTRCACCAVLWRARPRARERNRTPVVTAHESVLRRAAVEWDAHGIACAHCASAAARGRRPSSAYEGARVLLTRYTRGHGARDHARHVRDLCAGLEEARANTRSWSGSSTWSSALQALLTSCETLKVKFRNTAVRRTKHHVQAFSLPDTRQRRTRLLKRRVNQRELKSNYRTYRKAVWGQAVVALAMAWRPPPPPTHGRSSTAGAQTAPGKPGRGHLGRRRDAGRLRHRARDAGGSYVATRTGPMM